MHTADFTVLSKRHLQGKMTWVHLIYSTAQSNDFSHEGSAGDFNPPPQNEAAALAVEGRHTRLSKEEQLASSVCMQ